MFQKFEMLSLAWKERGWVSDGSLAACLSLTSLKRMMLGWRSERWLMISRCTFSSICNGNGNANAST